MRKRIVTKQEKLQFIINKLTWLKGLEFTDDDEKQAVNYANTILRGRIKELDKIEPKKEKKRQYIENCTVCSDCDKCYRKIVCEKGDEL